MREITDPGSGTAATLPIVAGLGRRQQIVDDCQRLAVDEFRAEVSNVTTVGREYCALRVVPLLTASEFIRGVATDDHRI